MVKGKNKNKKIKFDVEAGVFVQTEETIIGPGSKDLRILKNQLKFELMQIIEQVKKHKERADEIREELKQLNKIEGLEGPSANSDPGQYPAQLQ